MPYRAGNRRAACCVSIHSSYDEVVLLEYNYDDEWLHRTFIITMLRVYISIKDKVSMNASMIVT